MFGFTVRTRQNSIGSPKSVDSPTSVGSPLRVGSPMVSTNSPKADIGEIDTRAPFQSVKAAVSLFGDVNSPRSSPVTKKSKAEERVLEKETQHHMILRELDYYKDKLRSAENAKAQALKELQRANRTLQQLTNKLETLSESKQASIKATEAAKTRAKELEEQKSLRKQLGSEAWKLDVDSERERYKASAGELILSKQEFTNLRQDFDAALEAKLAAFQEAEDAQHNAKVNQERESQLSTEVASLREALDQVKVAALQAEEEHSKLIEEKEALLLNYKSATEAAEMEIKSLKEEYDPAENLEEKLEETTEAIKVLQEQLNGVRASDLYSLQIIVSELDKARKELQEVLAEESSMRTSAEPLKLQLEEVKRERSESEIKALKAESTVEKMQDELQKRKSELEAAISGNASDDMQSSIEKLKEEAEKDRHEAEEIRKKAELLKQEAEAARIATKEAEEKLQIALKQAEAAKAAEKLADDQIHDSPRTDAGDSKESGPSIRKIKLTVEEFELMNKKIEQFSIEADVKVATAMAQVQTLNASEKEVLQKVEVILKENEDLQSEIEDALKRSEMAEAAKKVVEGELKKWRIKEQNEVGEPSNVSEE